MVTLRICFRRSNEFVGLILCFFFVLNDAFLIRYLFTFLRIYHAIF